MDNNLFHVFISYSRTDKKIKDKLIKDLHKIGLKVWIDTNELSVGTPHWEKAIRTAIPISTYIIYLASETSCISENVLFELKLAKRHKKSILPAWVKGKEWIDCTPAFLSMAQYADMREKNYSIGLKELLLSIRSKILEEIILELNTQSLIKDNTSFITFLEFLNSSDSIQSFTRDDYDEFCQQFISRNLIQQKKSVFNVLDILIKRGLCLSSHRDEEILYDYTGEIEHVYDEATWYGLTDLGKYLCEVK